MTRGGRSEAPEPHAPRQIIVPHTNTDLDALGSALAAQILYPGAQILLPGMLLPGAAEFASLHRYQIRARSPREVDLSRVEQVIMVDTRDPGRIGPLAEVAQRPGMRLHLYDHHPTEPGDLTGEVEVVDPVGACATLMVELLQEAGVPVSSFHATALLLGIYADTDNLTIPSTTSRDVRAAAWLLDQGASLRVVEFFTTPELSAPQQELLEQLLANTRLHTVRGVKVRVVTGTTASYVGGLARLVHKLCDLRPAPATFVVVQMGDRVHLVGRSDVPWVDAGRTMAAFGGGGHHDAAAAVVKGRTAAEVAAELLEMLEREGISRPVTARDLMNSPVRAIPPELSIAEAERLMLRYGYSGLVVVDPEHRAIGVVSRRDVEKARRHGLTHAPVKGVMSRPALTVDAGTPIDEVQALLVERDIGRLPVVAEGRLVGIITRSDVLGELYGTPAPHWHRVLYHGEGPDAAAARGEVLYRAAGLPAPVARALAAAGRVARETAVPAYAVGGFVRDLLLGRPNTDVDIVVEGDGIAFAARLAAALGGRSEPVPRFGTAHVWDAGGFRVDVASARREFYEYAAALPRVELSDLREDLYRRDFTIGAMAIRLTPEGLGDVVDFFGGYQDLKAGLVRVLHSLSFVEDPTRLLRAARFAGRYGMRLEAETARLAREAIEGGFLERVSPERIRNELVRLLQEEQAPACLAALQEWGALARILPEVRWDAPTRERLAGVEAVLAGRQPDGSPLPPAVQDLAGRSEAWRLYLLALGAGIAAAGVPPLVERLRLPRRDRLQLLMGLSLYGEVLTTLRQPAVRPSVVAEILAGWPAEGLIILWLSGQGGSPAGWVERYWDELRHVRPTIDGSDLERAGVPKGRVYAQALAAARAARLDGRAGSRGEELAVALAVAEAFLKNGKGPAH